MARSSETRNARGRPSDTGRNGRNGHSTRIMSRARDGSPGRELIVVVGHACKPVDRGGHRIMARTVAQLSSDPAAGVLADELAGLLASSTPWDEIAQGASTRSRFETGPEFLPRSAFRTAASDLAEDAKGDVCSIDHGTARTAPRRARDGDCFHWSRDDSYGRQLWSPCSAFDGERRQSLC